MGCLLKYAHFDVLADVCEMLNIFFSDNKL